MIKKWLLACVVGICSVLVFGETVRDLEQSLKTLNDEETNLYRKVAGQLRCPTCTGMSVLDSDVIFSLQIKSAVAEQVQKHQTEQDILSFFTKRYGVWILREPPKEGFHLVSWLTPVGIALLGLALLVRIAKRKPALVDSGIRSKREIIAQMETELAHRRAL